MENTSNRFVKTERLSSKTQIQQIFDKGSVLFLHPLKIYYQLNEDSFCRVLITVPKRLYKKAVDRNLLKRRIREAYRLNKEQLSTGPFVDINIVYISGEILEFKLLNNKISDVLAKIKKSIPVGSVPSVSDPD
ncbi:MAG: ribonuclease P protein component [Rikenellaceae bacterium]